MIIKRANKLEYNNKKGERVNIMETLLLLIRLCSSSCFVNTSTCDASTLIIQFYY